MRGIVSMRCNLLKQIVILLIRRVHRNFDQTKFSVVFIIKLLWHLFNFYAIFLVTSYYENISISLGIKLSVEGITLMLFFFYMFSFVLQLFFMRIKAILTIFLKKVPVSKNKIAFANLLITVLNLPLLYTILTFVFLFINIDSFEIVSINLWVLINILLVLCIQMVCLFLKLTPYIWGIVVFFMIYALYFLYKRLDLLLIKISNHYSLLFSVELLTAFIFIFVALLGINFLLFKKNILNNT